MMRFCKSLALILTGLVMSSQVVLAEVTNKVLEIDALMLEPSFRWTRLLKESTAQLDDDFFLRHVKVLRQVGRSSKALVRECSFLYSAALSADRADAAQVAISFNEDLKSQCYLGVMMAEDSIQRGELDSAYSSFASLAKDLYRPGYCHYRMAEIRFLQGDKAGVASHFREANRYESQLETSKLSNEF
jgi:hypothetical protein